MWKCLGCEEVLYCDRSCQNKDWKEVHSIYCKTKAENQQVNICKTSKLLIDEELPAFNKY